MDQKTKDAIVLVAVRDTIAMLVMNKPNDHSEKDRVYAVAKTQVELALGILTLEISREEYKPSDAEVEADADIAAGRVQRFSDVEALTKFLDKEYQKMQNKKD